MKLPPALTAVDESKALDLLRCYYGRGGGHPHRPYEGAWFDTWDSSGDRVANSDRFTADDVVAVTFLSVSVPPLAVIELLHRQSADFSASCRSSDPTGTSQASRSASMTLGSAGSCSSVS